MNSSKFVVMFVLFIFSSQNASAQLHSQDVISNGGVLIDNNNYRIHGTVGQPLIGVINNSSYEIQQGFWNQLKARPTNIVLSTLTAQVTQDGILINWTTETEPNNAGFNVHRNQQENVEYVKINDTLIPSQGNATTGASYSYVDKPEQEGDYYYKLQDVSLDGSVNFHDPVFVVVTSVDLKKYGIPKKFTLSQNYPNPFNPKTNINFTLPNSDIVQIVVYNLNGKVVATLFNGKKDAGYHSLQWNASNIPSGVYFIKMQAGMFMQIKKCLLLK
jgi:hypothetical protein